MKTNFTEREINKIRDLVCEAILHKSPDHKQYLLIEIGGIITGSKDKFLESAEAQGYNISKGVKP